MLPRSLCVTQSWSPPWYYLRRGGKLQRSLVGALQVIGMCPWKGCRLLSFPFLVSFDFWLWGEWLCSHHHHHIVTYPKPTKINQPSTEGFGSMRQDKPSLFLLLFQVFITITPNKWMPLLVQQRANYQTVVSDNPESAGDQPGVKPTVGSTTTSL